MMTKKYTKFEKDSLKDSRVTLWTDGHTEGRTDRRTERVILVNPTSTSWRWV